MYRILSFLILLISFNGISQTYFFDDFDYENFEALDSLYQNRVKNSFWRTQHAVSDIDISEDGIIEDNELFKNTTIIQDPFDKNNKVIRFELDKVNPLFYAKYACDDWKHDNVKNDASLKDSFNAAKNLYCSGCNSGPLGLNLPGWRTHMNRNEFAIYGKNRRMYKAKRDQWFGLKMLIDSDYELDTLSNPEIVTQFHNIGKDAKNPVVSLRIINGRFKFTLIKNNDGVQEYFDVGPVIKNKWIDWKYRLSLSNKDKKGLIEVWRDGEKLVSISGRNVFKNQKYYLKIGIYKWGWWDCGLPASNSQKKVIFFDKIWAGKLDRQL